MTHWRGKSSYCVGDAECKECRAGREAIWKGYFAGEAWDARRGWWLPVVMELTEACELDLRYRFCRGQVWLFERSQQTTKKRTPVTARLVEELPLDTLPPAFDVHAVLRTLYHANHIALTTANPLPDRVMIEPTAGAAPGATAPKEEPVVERRTFRELMDLQRVANGANGNGKHHG
jgi:hypothetical protein